MRILANENAPGACVASLEKLGHDVVWIRTDAPGSSDPLILRRAQAENRIVLTFDKDFGELAFHSRLPAAGGVILVRIRATSPEAVVGMTVAALQSRTDWAGHFSVIENDRIRIKPLAAAAPPQHP